MTALTLQERAVRAAETEMTKPLCSDDDIFKHAFELGYIAGAKAECVIALEDAAKLMCWQCGRGIAVARADEQEWCHLYANDPGCVPCQASDIHTLIAFAREAEAGGKEKG